MRLSDEESEATGVVCGAEVYHRVLCVLRGEG